MLLCLLSGKWFSYASKHLFLCGGELSPLLETCALYIILKIVQLGLIYGAKQEQGWWKRQEQRYID